MKKTNNRRRLNLNKIKSTVRGWKPVYIIIVLVVVVLVVLRLCLNGIVLHYVNKKLNDLPGYTGHVNDIGIALWRGAYVIEGLELRKKSDPPKYPFLEIDRTDFAIQWRSLFKGRLVGKVELNRPIINILSSEDISKEPSKDSWTKTVKALMPMTINHLQVTDGRLAYYDFDKKPPFNLHINDLQLTATNLANVQKSADRLRSSLILSGTSIGGGKLNLNMKVNVLKDIPDFDAALKLTNVDILSLNTMLEASVKFDVERGRIDVFGKLKVIDGQMDGYIKPSFIGILKNAFIQALHESIAGGLPGRSPEK